MAGGMQVTAIIATLGALGGSAEDLEKVAAIESVAADMRKKDKPGDNDE